MNCKNYTHVNTKMIVHMIVVGKMRPNLLDTYLSITRLFLQLTHAKKNRKWLFIGTIYFRTSRPIT